MMKKEPVKCKACKSEPKISGGQDFMVYCDTGMGDCWYGPIRDTEEEAVNAWNSVMKEGENK
jgi:hypothetical protein